MTSAAATVQASSAPTLSARLTARLAAVLFGVGGVIAAATLALPIGRGTDPVGMLGASAVALACGFVTWYLPWDRWGERATLAIVPLALTLVSVGQAIAHGNRYTYGLYLVLILGWVGVAHRRYTPTLLSPLVVVAYVLPLSLSVPTREALGAAAAVVPIAVLMAESIAWVAERLRATERVLREREATMALAVGQMPAIMWTWDREGRFTSCVGAGLANIGLSGSDFVGRTVHEVLSAEEAGEVSAAVIDEAIRGVKHSILVRWGDRIFEAHSEAFTGLAGELIGTIGIALDVTERVRAEDALRGSERTMRHILETVPLLVVSADRAGRVTFCNRAFSKLTGWSRAEIEGVEWFERFVPGRVGEAREAFRAAVAAGDLPDRYEHPIVTRAGDERLVSWSTTILREGSGAVAGVMAIGEDVTERREAEVSLQRTLERERQAVEHFRRADELKNVFLEAVSHELRTPLTSVVGYANTLDRDHERLTDEERRDALRRLSSNARKLETLLRDLLDLDRLARGAAEPRLRPTDVAAVVRGIVEQVDLGPRLLELAIPERLALRVDAPRLERIVENLLVNAARHTPPGARLRLGLAHGDGSLLVTLAQDGPGVPDAMKGEIFKPFHRGAAHPNVPGVGIGLSLVARFAELHGGEAWVEDRPGGGAVFAVRLTAPVDAPLDITTVPAIA